jgi:hypothetical protein
LSAGKLSSIDLHLVHGERLQHVLSEYIKLASLIAARIASGAAKPRHGDRPKTRNSVG